MVKVRGRNSNGKTVKQTAENGRKISGDDVARPAWVTGARRQQFAAASRFWSIPNLMPRSTVTRVWLTEWTHLGQLCGTLTSDNLFFFFFLSFRECCLTRQWQRVECDTRYMVQRKKFDVILRFLVDRYRRTKPPKPDASQFVVPARLPKPVIGSGGLSSSRFDDDVPEVNSTWTASFSWRVKEAALWFESHGSKNMTGGTTWSSQSTSTDWLTRTYHWSSPRSKLAYKKPTSTRKLRKFPVTSGQGSKHRDWTASRWWARWRSQPSSCQHHVITWRRADSGWSRISWFRRVTLPWLRGGTSVAPWRHKWAHVPVFRRLFDRLPVRISTSYLHHRKNSTEKTLSYQSLWFWSAVFPFEAIDCRSALLLLLYETRFRLLRFVKKLSSMKLFSTYLRLQGDHYCACAQKWCHFSYFSKAFQTKKN